MTTTTPYEIHKVIRDALALRADKLRKDASSRRFGGPAYKDLRADLRTEAELCDHLVRITDTPGCPQRLADALGEPS